MCELLGVSSEQPIDIRAYLKVFYRHSVKHPHGWGLFRKTQRCDYEVIKEPVCASGSRILSCIIQQTIPQTTALAHIRLATVGSVKRENCHPYTGLDNQNRKWTMIHNGTIYSSKHLAKYLNIQQGDTDSERVFLYLLDTINAAQKTHVLSPKERFAVVERVVKILSPRNKLNVIIYDGELLYVHKNMKDTFSYRKKKNSIIFSTTPLEIKADENLWEDYPLAQLCAFRNGRKVIEGQPHDGIFIPSLEYITAMAAMHI